MTLTYLNPTTLAAPVGYTHVVAATGRTMVYISGQVGLNDDGSVAGVGDPRQQIEQTYRNLGAALTAAGATFSDVVKLTTYLVDIAHLPIIREVRPRYFVGEHPPASTLVAVTSLFRPEFLVEIEAVAVLP
jgi:enamine deaminase RidA (YjgF/YER057c/UK114 family)